jgi:hypothetical protein
VITNKHITLCEELKLSEPKIKFTEKMINKYFLNKIVNDKNKSIPTVKISPMGIVLRVTTTKVKEYLSGSEEMEDWRKTRLVQLLNILNELDFKERNERLKEIAESILKNRRRTCSLTNYEGLENFIADNYQDVFKTSNDLEILNNLSSSKNEISICPRLISLDKKNKVAEIIEFDFSNSPNTDDRKKKIHLLGYYSIYLSKNPALKLKGYNISFVLVCSSPTKGMIVEASVIGVTIKELTFKARQVTLGRTPTLKKTKSQQVIC